MILDAGADRAALLRRYNAAVVTDAPITDDIATLSDFDGAKKVRCSLPSPQVVVEGIEHF